MGFWMYTTKASVKQIQHDPSIVGYHFVLRMFDANQTLFNTIQQNIMQQGDQSV